MNDKVTVNVRELRDKLARYLSQVGQVDQVTITSRGKAIAKIIPAIEKTARAASIGAMEGRNR